LHSKYNKNTVLLINEWKAFVFNMILKVVVVVMMCWWYRSNIFQVKW